MILAVDHQKITPDSAGFGAWRDLKTFIRMNVFKKWAPRARLPARAGQRNQSLLHRSRRPDGQELAAAPVRGTA
ncbi:MAG TPA: hypothetical protein VE549_07565 [Myxococcaceae bacterium]|nr:hypothetical protein [Myxococcaceae bacterium]